MELQFETNSSTKTHFSYSSIRSHFILNSSFPNPRCKHSFVYKSFLLVLMTSWGEVGTVEATRDGGEDDGGGNVADRIETGGLHCRLKPQSISSNIKTPIDFSTSRKEIRIEKKTYMSFFMMKKQAKRIETARARIMTNRWVEEDVGKEEEESFFVWEGFFVWVLFFFLG